MGFCFCTLLLLGWLLLHANRLQIAKEFANRIYQEMNLYRMLIATGTRNANVGRWKLLDLSTVILNGREFAQLDEDTVIQVTDVGDTIPGKSENVEKIAAAVKDVVLPKVEKAKINASISLFCSYLKRICSDEIFQLCELKLNC